MRKTEIKSKVKSNSLRRNFNKKIAILTFVMFCLGISGFMIAGNAGAFANGNFSFGFTNPTPTPAPQTGKPKRNAPPGIRQPTGESARAINLPYLL